MKYVFYVALSLYAAYNVFWLIGTTFSWGRNDTRSEMIYLLLTFIADIPVIWWIKRNPRNGGIALSILLVAGLSLAASLRVFNSFSLLFWYAPKLILAALGVLTNRLEKRSESLLI